MNKSPATAMAASGSGERFPKGKTATDAAINQNLVAIQKMETSGDDSNAALSSLAKLLEEKTVDPSLLGKLGNFLVDESPDPVPVTEKTHPVFYNAAKNDEMYNFKPKRGVGIQKDGTKLHCFDYEASMKNRSKDLYGGDIQAAIDANNIYRLSNLLVAAFTDLLLNGNSDMKSYMYLMDKATFALSDEVKEEIAPLDEDGGVALALVTELVATSSSAEGMFIRAVLSREKMDDLDGLEGLNESYVRKVYAAITPMVETKGILLNNGIDIKTGWGFDLAQKAPSVDKLVAMDFNTFKSTVHKDDKKSEGAFADLKAPTGDQLIAHQMYAGLLGPHSSNVSVPAIRGYVLKNDLNMQVADQMEKIGHEDLTQLFDKDILNDSRDILKSFGEQHGKKAQADRDNFMKRKLMDAVHDSLLDKVKDRRPMKRMKSVVGRFSSANPTIASAGRAALKSAGRSAASSALRGLGLTTGATAGAGMAGMAGMAGLAAMAGPLSVALALAPIIKELAADTDRRMDEDMNAVVSEREKMSAEVSELLESVRSATGNTKEGLEDAQNKAEALLDKVRNPNALALSEAQGMGLQKQLQALETRFSPTSMGSLVPYTSNEELVAAVDSGKALAAVSIFLDPEVPITTPQRQMLQTPRYVNMMGASQPFRTFSKRSTSERETKSFISSASHSGFSTADKTVKDRSKSKSGKLNAIVAGAKVKISSSKQNTDEEKSADSDSKERNDELAETHTKAIVTEFTIMPMATFRLRESGLALSPYAYYRLQRITDDKVDDVEIDDPVRRDATRRYKAREFIKNFGSHVPFGVQTLGGVFIRSMIITTESTKSLSVLYATASSQLTKSNSEASKTTRTGTARAGIFGTGTSVTSSSGHSSARSSGRTDNQSNTEGSGTGRTSTESNFESDVTCFGPNAATQDDLYLQLMSNNRTWTVIDRGEADSYFAIWDLIEYLGQGGALGDQRKLLKEVWEEMALENSGDDSNALLDIVMRDFAVKKKMFNFVQALIYCLVPKKGNRYDADLAENFEQVITAGCNAITSDGGIFDPKKLIEIGARSLDNVELEFDLVPGNEGYKIAMRVLNETPSNEWVKHFSFYSDSYRAAIISKGKPSYLFDVCTVCCSSRDENNWDLVDKIINPDLSGVSATTEALFKADLDRYLSYEDEESGNYCLHLVLKSNKLKLVQRVHKACTSIAEIENNENESPKKHLAKLYNNIKHYSFPKNPLGGVPQVWAVDSDNNVHYLADKKWMRFDIIQIKHIATSNNGDHVWGVGTYGSVHYLCRNISTEWKTISCPKRIDSIAVSADGCHVWAIDMDGSVCKFIKEETKPEQWKFEPDDAVAKTRLKSISVSGDGSKVFGIRRADGNCVRKSQGGWIEEVGTNDSDSKGVSFERVSVSPDGRLLWVTDCDGNVYSDFMGKWQCLDAGQGKKIRHLVVDNGANVWGTGQDDDSTVWYRKQANSEWVNMATGDTDSVSSDIISFKQISSCDTSITPNNPFRGRHIWLVAGELNTLYHLCHENYYVKEKVSLPGGCTTVTFIASNSNGDVWIVDNRKKLFYRPKDSPTWHYLRGNIGPIAAGGRGGLVWISQVESSQKAFLHYSKNGDEIIMYELATTPLSVAINDKESCLCFTGSQGKLRYIDLPENIKVSGYHLESTGAILGNGISSLSNDCIPLGLQLPSSIAPITPNEFPGFFSIRSVSSKQYLNGRVKGPQNIEVWLDIPDSFRAKPKYFNWTFEKVGTQYKIRSNSSGLYIDGRDPNHVNQDGVVVLATDEGTNTKYLLWDIEKVDGNYALKSNSSGAYLDGRVANLTRNKLWLTNRPPKGDGFLQWIIEPQEGIPHGTYTIKTTVHEASGCPAGWGLSVWRQPSDGVRGAASTWVAAHDGDVWPSQWEIKKGRAEGTYQIASKPHAKLQHPGGWGLCAFPRDGAKRDEWSTRIAVHRGTQWHMDWKIVPGRTKGTYQLVTTEHTAGGQKAGWGLSAWGPKVPDTIRNANSSWVYVHEETIWQMDWILEKVEEKVSKVEDKVSESNTALLQGNVRIQNNMSETSFSTFGGLAFESSQSVSMSSDGEHVWGIQKDGKLSYIRSKDGLREEIYFDKNISKVSVS